MDSRIYVDKVDRNLGFYCVSSFWVIIYDKSKGKKKRGLRLKVIIKKRRVPQFLNNQKQPSNSKSNQILNAKYLKKVRIEDNDNKKKRKKIKLYDQNLYAIQKFFLSSLVIEEEFQELLHFEDLRLND